VAGSSLGFKHTEGTKQNMKDNYSPERKERIGGVNRGKQLTEETKALIRAKASQRTEEVKEKYRKASSIPVTVFNLDGSVKGTYSGIRAMAQDFKCCHKAIKNNTLFKGAFYLKKYNSPWVARGHPGRPRGSNQINII